MHDHFGLTDAQHITEADTNITIAYKMSGFIVIALQWCVVTQLFITKKII